ncbi:MAG TPA: hypothetical protein VFA33_21840 [Bryobacteraceae bacterium]|nr:hypothetical protein [Bryobacteraceae bacterium]
MAGRPQEGIQQILGASYPKFQELVGRGCNARDLGGLLVMLHNPEIPLKSGRTLYLAPHDRHEIMLKGLTLKEGRALLKRARRALCDFQNALAALDGARIWSATQFSHQDLLCAKDTLDRGLDALDKAFRTVGPKSHPDFNGRIERIIRYVKEKTGTYNDELLAEVLGAASPEKMPRFPSAEALRNWRNQRGIIGSVR